MALWPFKPSTLLDADTMQWHVDIVCWFLENCGDRLPAKPARLILPGRGFYRITEAGGPALVEQVFQQTKAFAGLAEWQYDLVAESPLVLPADTDLIEIANDPDGDDLPRGSIGYLSQWQNDPFPLIGWFARALGQELVKTIEDQPPCDEDQFFAASDVVAGMLGFGVFLADGAVSLQCGRYATRNPDAALSEVEFVFDIALFLTLHNLPADGAAQFLKAHLADRLKPALRDAAPFRHALLAAQARGAARPRLIPATG